VLPTSTASNIAGDYARPVPAKLWGVPASHPTDCVEAALQLKRIDYRRVDLVPVVHKLPQRLRFGAPTVPGLRIDGERIVGSRRILRRLDELAPEPSLYPDDAALRARVEEAEAWGDEVLQPRARRIAWGILRHRTSAMPSYAADANLPLPSFTVRLSSPLVAQMASRANHADDATVRADLAELPSDLDRIDAWIADGVLGGDSPNAADLQIGSSVRLLRSFGDVAPLIEQRPAAQLGGPPFRPLGGKTPAGSAPADWLPHPGG
jgi:glutathione S-transferase